MESGIRLSPPRKNPTISGRACRARGASVQPMSPMRRDCPYRVAIMETGMAGKAPFRRLSNRMEATFRFDARNETLIEYGPTFVRVSGTVRRACFPPLIPCENWLFNIFARYSTGFQNRGSNPIGKFPSPARGDFHQIRSMGRCLGVRRRLSFKISHSPVIGSSTRTVMARSDPLATDIRWAVSIRRLSCRT